MRVKQLALVQFLGLLSIGSTLEDDHWQSWQKPISPDDAYALDSDFDQFVEDLLARWHVPGLSIAVIDNGTIWSKGYGYATLPDVKATADTQYFTGSTTKAFTAAAAALLVHNNSYPNLDWSSRISDVIGGDFALEDEHATIHTTLEDALSHRSGLPRHDLMYGRPGDTLSSIVQRMRHLPMTAEPRTKFQYCNLMYAVVTDLLETVTGVDLESILRENFWKPLGMSSTTFTLPSDADNNTQLARGYWWDGPYRYSAVLHDSSRYVPDRYIDIMPISGAGATISTVNDYALWIQAIIDAASYETFQNRSSPVTRRMLRDVASPRSIVFDDIDLNDSRLPPLYALGWETAEILGQWFIAHDGGLTGFGTNVYVFPDKRYGIVTMGNTMGTSNWVGAYIANYLFLKKLGISTTDQHAVSATRNAFLRKLDVNLRPRLTSGSTHPSTDLLRALLSSRESLPRPGSIEDYAGHYSHPAYGGIDIKLCSPHADSPNSNETLEILLHDRLWPIKYQLGRETSSIFNTKVFEPHGLGDILTGEGIVWVYEGELVTIFEHRVLLDRQATDIERVGIILDFDMVETAVRKRKWREAFIWFDKT